MARFHWQHRQMITFRASLIVRAFLEFEILIGHFIFKTFLKPETLSPAERSFNETSVLNYIFPCGFAYGYT